MEAISAHEARRKPGPLPPPHAARGRPRDRGLARAARGRAPLGAASRGRLVPTALPRGVDRILDEPPPRAPVGHAEPPPPPEPRPRLRPQGPLALPGARLDRRDRQLRV